MKRKLFFYIIIAMVSFNLMSIVALASTDISYVQAENSDIEVRVDDIGYQYKVIDNVLYRRLYNFTARKPLGDWEVAA